jgi:DNA-binding MarR family transcriptional regulator
MPKPNNYKAPVTISRKEFLVQGSDAEFRRSIYAMVQSVGRLLACRDAFGRELNLTPSQFVVLMGVAHAQGSGGITIRGLADHVALASTHVTTEVRRLEEAGLLAKRPSPVDKRSVRVFLQARGEQEVARIAPFIRLINDVLFQDIDPDALKTAQHVARQLILNSESALAEIRKHHLQRKDGPAVANRTAVTSHGAKRPYPAESRAPPRNEAAGTARRGKAKASSSSG